VKLCAFMRKAVAELISDMDSVRLYLPDSEWVISADEKRLMQLTENILNNAAKYGKMPVDITIRQKDNDTVQINFKDYGNGMKDEDIPFALDKFYRGKNSADKPGAGLGLYIVKYITNKMNGEVRLYNHVDGLEVVVELPVKG
jgi:signal transduction histidine kinase